MTIQWKIVDSFGSIEEVARLAKEAILMAEVTGSVGGSVRNTSFETGEIVVTAFAKVARIEPSSKPTNIFELAAK
jgi:hypothetical protein